MVVSSAIVSVLFPMFGSLHRVDPAEAFRLYRKGLRSVFLILAPILFVAWVASPFILLHWLGPDFARQGSGVMRILCLGVLINALAAVPFAFIQGIARPDITAKLHLAEAPVYLLVLWILGTHFGLLGVAWAWTIRVTADFILLLLGVWRYREALQKPSGPDRVPSLG